MTKLDESKRAGMGASELLAAAAAIAAGTQVYAEVVIFINPEPGEQGHFDWDYGFPATPAQWLDITLPSTDQGGLVGPSSVGQLFHFQGSGAGGTEWNATAGGAAVAHDNSGGYGVGPFTLSLPAGATIDGQLTFSGSYQGAVHASQFHNENYDILTSNFVAGEAGHMGVRFSDVDGYHYGWISVVRNSLDFDAFAWGYETEPGVPIVAGIPAPGTLAALAFGAVVTRRGRKRKDN